MEIYGLIITSKLIAQAGMVLGMLGSIMLAFSVKVGTISKDGNIIFNDLDPMQPAEENKRKVLRSHRRNRYFVPIGWLLLAMSFCLQFTATL